MSKEAMLTLQDISAETGIICTLIHNPDFIHHSDHLSPSYFYNKENGAIYWAIRELYNKGIDRIDEFNLTMQINSNAGVKRIIESVRENFISDLIFMSSSLVRESINEYIELVNIVCSLSFKRELYRKLSFFQQACIDPQNDLNQLNKKIIEDLDGLVTKYITKEGAPLYKDVIDHVWDTIISKRNSDGTYGILSKWPILEKYFTYQSGELILIAARRKEGKSILAMNELVHKLKQGVPCCYFDTEMRDEIFTTRLISHLTGIKEYRVKSGNYSATEEILIKDAMQWLKSVNFCHVYEPRWSKEMVYSKAKIYKHKINFQFFIYDYIKITENNVISSSEQYNELGNWCNFLKNDIAGGLDVPVLSFAQLNRENNIADSDKLERYASTGIRWQRKTKEEILRDGEQCGNFKMEIMFNRLGESTDEDEYIDFVFDNESLSINECKVQHSNENNMPEILA